MFGCIKSKGLKISAELHEKIASAGDPINMVESEIVAYRKVPMRKLRREMIAQEARDWVHVYG
ncbi:MAG: hypothetical protein PHS86_01900 [Syntrophaceae bacterium]|nr:hypothetical protein [Syntrophaceae bacterium]